MKGLTRSAVAGAIPSATFQRRADLPKACKPCGSASDHPVHKDSARSLAQPASIAGEMPAIALLAAVAGQTLAELSPVPECGGAGFGLGREPAFACARFAATRLVGLLVREPAFDVPLTHDRAYA